VARVADKPAVQTTTDPGTLLVWLIRRLFWLMTALFAAWGCLLGFLRDPTGSQALLEQGVSIAAFAILGALVGLAVGARLQ
jgi:hypothetical protein